MKVTNDRASVLFTALNMVARDTGVEIGKGATVKFGVNWAALGTVNPKDAKKYAEQIKRAADIADALNKLEIEIVFQDDTLINSDERYMGALDRVVALLKDRNCVAVGEFMKGGL